MRLNNIPASEMPDRKILSSDKPLTLSLVDASTDWLKVVPSRINSLVLFARDIEKVLYCHAIAPNPNATC